MKYLIAAFTFVAFAVALSAQNCPAAGFDANGDLSIGSADLVEFLTVFGQNLDQDGDGIIDCEDPCVGDSIACPPWSCGDDLEYFGYAYQTVEIGDQCWFAENLRTMQYSNGDSLLYGLNIDDWLSPFTSTGVGIGATAVYGEGQITCEDLNPDLESCNDSISLQVQGRLYNIYAVLDERNVCPSGWHVSTDFEWNTLNSYLQNDLGFICFTGGTCPAPALKSTSGWLENNGTNLLGFNAYPTGWRDVWGEFLGSGLLATYWTPIIGNVINPVGYRWLYYQSDEVPMPGTSGMNLDGRSIRCIKD